MREVLEKVVEGDEAAWRTLWTKVHPWLWAMTAKFRITSVLSERDDERRNVVLAVMEHLRSDGFGPLRAFLASEAQRGGKFRTWLGTVAARVAIDYVRAHAEFVGHRGASAPDSARQRWVHHDPMPESGPAAPTADIIDAVQVAEVLDRARLILTPAQLQVLELRMADLDYKQIAQRLGLKDAEAAEKVLHAAHKRLRDSYDKE